MTEISLIVTLNNQFNNNNNNLPWLYWKFVFDNNFLRVSDFCEGFAPILLIATLWKDKVPSVEKPYADIIFTEMLINYLRSNL